MFHRRVSVFHSIPREQEACNFWVNYKLIAMQKIFTLTSHKDKISGLLNTSGFNVGLKWPECQVLDINSYFSDFKLVITSDARPCRLRCASTFKLLRTRRSDPPCQLSFSVLYSKPTQLDRPRHGSVLGEVQVQTKTGSSGICGGQSGSGTVFFFRRISVVTCQYHSANTPYAFIHLSPTLHNPYQLTASLNNTLHTATYRTSLRASSRGTVF